MTNTFMLGGRDDPGEILARAKTGIYAEELRRRPGRHHQRQVRLLLHRGLSDREWPTGAPIKGATLIGDGPTVLTKVAAIGNDMALDEGVGICGKGGQSVPAGVGQPTLLIEGLTVGGHRRLSEPWVEDLLTFWFGLEPEQWFEADPPAGLRDPQALSRPSRAATGECARPFPGLGPARRWPR
jgi:hypothetical protein